MKLPLDLPKGKDLRGDLAAGLTNGLVQIPDAMASAILALVKPVNGLNTLIIGTPVGALFAGSVFMTVATTGAVSLAVADALGGTDSSERTVMLVVLTLLVGVIQLALGVLKLGWVTKFVSNSVMVGFITGVCILIKWCHNYVDRERYYVESPEPVPAGEHELRFEFEVTSPPDIATGRGAGGSAQLYVDGGLVAAAEVPTTTPLTLGLTSGVLCGRATGAPVTPDYSPPAVFTGRLHKVVVDVSGELITDDEATLRMLMARQ